MFIEPCTLASRLGEPGLRVIDASWYLPSGTGMARNAHAEFLEARVPGAVFFDIDTIAERNSGLPHTLASAEAFSAAASALGLSNTDTIVVYDGAGLFSAPRVRWNLLVMGARDVWLLAGGFPAWRAAGQPIESGKTDPVAPGRFRARLDTSFVATLGQTRRFVAEASGRVIDVRAPGRFAGTEPEPRAGLRAGHMPGAVNLPWQSLLIDGRLRPDTELARAFRSALGDDAFEALATADASPDPLVITSCGSGVTAAIASLALERLGIRAHALYDGSWSEWGAREDTPVITATSTTKPS